MATMTDDEALAYAACELTYSQTPENKIPPDLQEQMISWDSLADTDDDTCACWWRFCLSGGTTDPGMLSSLASFDSSLLPAKDENALSGQYWNQVVHLSAESWPAYQQTISYATHYPHAGHHPVIMALWSVVQPFLVLSLDGAILSGDGSLDAADLQISE